MKKGCSWFLLPLVLLLTGCPHNDYTVTLTPRGDKMHRELVFYRGDGDTNGAIKYEGFPPQELGLIMTWYPMGAVTNRGDSYIAKGDFAESMPADIGGAGAYSNLVTTIGNAGFYAERFRGDDDLAGQTEKRLAAASQFVNIVIGWSKTELGSETNYAQLRQFLDGQFRKDVKNAAFYWHDAREKVSADTNANMEYDVRFALYLLEKGYFKLGDVPALLHMLEEEDDARFLGFIQRLVARKLGVPDSQSVPASLAFLKDVNAMGTSFSNYFIGTDIYRDEIKEWEAAGAPPDKKPDAGTIMSQKILGEVIDFDLFGGPSDHLKVTLSLPVSPVHSNGRWDAAGKMVIWDSDLDAKTNASGLPVLCYANWGQPDESFQKQHFGRVIVTGEDLSSYCLWRAGLDEKHGVEWEKFLAELQPGERLPQLIEGFRFVDEKENPNSPNDDNRSSLSKVARDVLTEALAAQPADATK